MKAKRLSFLVGLMFLLCASSVAFGGKAVGKVIDITIRTQDDLMIIKMENHRSKPGCVDWVHNFGFKYNDAQGHGKALYTMFLTAQSAEKDVFVTGIGSCISGTGTEQIKEANIGPWFN